MLGVKLNPRQFLDRVAEELGRIDEVEVQALADAVGQCYEHGQTVFLCGNGGSGSNASHFCEDLGKGTLKREDFDNDKKKRLRVLSLTDNTPYILAWGNDESFERVFVEQLKNLARPGDLLIAISGSGNSENVLRAVDWANRNGLKTFGCTGFSGGKLRALAQQGLHVPLDDMGIVESLHLTAFHWVVDDLYRRIGLGGTA
ncbi:MAG: SIS domain-containing protein [Planctomycetes bacterium]|nr:SIS domain-containing protein [Planctomycetota bacterium]